MGARVWQSAELPIVHIWIVPYDLLHVLAQICAIGLGTYLNARQGISVRTTVLTSLLCLPVGFWGARALDTLEYASSYASVGDALARKGSSIYGGLFASFLVVWLVMRMQRIPFLKFLDGAAPALAASEAITRIGCFCAGCCYGVPWNGPWAVVFPKGSVAVSDMQAQGLLDAMAIASPPLHPVQLYSTAIMLVVTAYLLWRFPRRAFVGELFYTFLVSYGVLRLAVAPFRAEALASMKLFSILFIVAGATGLAMGRSSRVAVARAEAAS